MAAALYGNGSSTSGGGGARGRGKPITCKGAVACLRLLFCVSSLPCRSLARRRARLGTACVLDLCRSCSGGGVGSRSAAVAGGGRGGAAWSHGGPRQGALHLHLPHRPQRLEGRGTLYSFVLRRPAVIWLSTWSNYWSVFLFCYYLCMLPLWHGCCHLWRDSARRSANTLASWAMRQPGA